MEEKAVAAVAYALLITGLLLRKNRRVHPWLMLSGISIDFILVIVLQIQRNVIQDAITETFNALQGGHIAVSTIAVVLYIPVLILGARQWRGRGGRTGRLWHIRFALTAFTFRSAGFVLMFSM